MVTANIEDPSGTEILQKARFKLVNQDGEA
jgi:hypothetical protein